MSARTLRNLFFLWLAWIFILLGFQSWTAMRFQLRRPDFALEWTPIDTSVHNKLGKQYLNDACLQQTYRPGK